MPGKTLNNKPYCVRRRVSNGVAWVYLDDHIDEHPKILAAEQEHPAAPWIFICSIAYCRRNGTEGFIPEIHVRRLTASYPVREILCTVGLWKDANPHGIEVHDFTQWNRTAENRSASARNAAQVRWARKNDAPDA